MINPWLILGVHRKSTDEEVREAYYDLARSHHPDAGGDGEKFQAISYAYSQIRDKAARRETVDIKLHGMPKCAKCSGKGVATKTKGLTTKEYTACNGCGGAGVIIVKKEKENVVIELRGTTGAGGKGRDKKHKH